MVEKSLSKKIKANKKLVPKSLVKIRAAAVELFHIWTKMAPGKVLF